MFKSSLHMLGNARQREQVTSPLTESALRLSEGGHRTTLIYCHHLNKNIEHCNLKITKIWVQQK